MREKKRYKERKKNLILIEREKERGMYLYFAFSLFILSILLILLHFCSQVFWVGKCASVIVKAQPILNTFSSSNPLTNFISHKVN